MPKPFWKGFYCYSNGGGTIYSLPFTCTRAYIVFLYTVVFNPFIPFKRVKQALSFFRFLSWNQAADAGKNNNTVTSVKNTIWAIISDVEFNALTTTW